MDWFNADGEMALTDTRLGIDDMIDTRTEAWREDAIRNLPRRFYWLLAKARNDIFGEREDSTTS